jgi:hypothetical protein
MLVLRDAKAKDSVSMAMPFGVIVVVVDVVVVVVVVVVLAAPAELATRAVTQLRRAMNICKVLRIIAFPLVHATYHDNVNVHHDFLVVTT